MGPGPDVGHNRGSNPWTVIAHTAIGSPDTNAVTTSAIDTTGADLLVVGASVYDVFMDATNISDSKSNTWTALAESGANSHTRTIIYYCRGGTVGAGHTFTVGRNTSYDTITVLALSGSVASPQDQSAVNTTQNTTSQSTTSITPTNNGQMIITILSGNPDIGTISIDSGMTISDAVANVAGQHMAGAMAYFYQATAAAFNPTWSWVNSTNAIGSATSIASFKSQ